MGINVFIAIRNINNRLLDENISFYTRFKKTYINAFHEYQEDVKKSKACVENQIKAINEAKLTGDNIKNIPIPTKSKIYKNYSLGATSEGLTFEDDPEFIVHELRPLKPKDILFYIFFIEDLNKPFDVKRNLFMDINALHCLEDIVLNKYHTIHQRLRSYSRKKELAFYKQWPNCCYIDDHVQMFDPLKHSFSENDLYINCNFKEVKNYCAKNANQYSK